MLVTLNVSNYNEKLTGKFKISRILNKNSENLPKEG